MARRSDRSFDAAHFQDVANVALAGHATSYSNRVIQKGKVTPDPYEGVHRAEADLMAKRDTMRKQLTETRKYGFGGLSPKTKSIHWWNHRQFTGSS